MIASASSILVTIFVYITIPELLNLCGKCLVCCLISLFIFYVTLSYVNLNAGNYINLLKCRILAYTIYLAYFSTIICLNVTSYDLWKKFRHDKIRLRTHSDNKQFAKYLVYVWGLSTFLTIVTYLCDTIDALPSYLKPGLGTERCFLKGLH